MNTTRRTFKARLADLGFSMEIPDGFAEPACPHEEVDFSDPTKSAPLALLCSEVALAILCIAARPAYEDGSVDDWARFLCSHFGISIEGNVSGFVGGDTHQHPAVLIEGLKEENGEKFIMRVVALEDGKRLVTAHAMCPESLWPSFGPALERALASIELTDPREPTVPCVPGGPVPILDMYGITTGEWPMGRGKLRAHEENRAQKLAAAVEEARGHVARDAFDEAELVVRRVDSDIQGGVALAKLYESRLRELVPGSRKPDPAVEAVFRRALTWAQYCYPEPHTEYEAEAMARGRDEDYARLVDILGYRPAER